MNKEKEVLDNIYQEYQEKIKEIKKKQIEIKKRIRQRKNKNKISILRKLINKL